MSTPSASNKNVQLRSYEKIETANPLGTRDKWLAYVRAGLARQDKQ